MGAFQSDIDGDDSFCAPVYAVWGSARVRRMLRNRSRYEVANNPYAKGVVLTLASDVLGTGPRLDGCAGGGG